jgi:hypothetical protein
MREVVVAKVTLEACDMCGTYGDGAGVRKWNVSGPEKYTVALCSDDAAVLYTLHNAAMVHRDRRPKTAISITEIPLDNA